jgi:signal transduction histidine kinase/CheY-like chemotaxis protein
MSEESRPSILVVEDENVVAMDLVSSLAKLLYPVAGVAASGEEAIALAQSTKPDLVLMDIHLRGDMNGIGAAQQIQENLFIPVVYLTAYSDQGTLDQARLTQPFGYILKPFEDREVDVAIQIALYRHKMDLLLRDSQRRLDTILASISDAVIATDNQRRITFLNRSAETLLGWKPERARGRLLSDVLKIAGQRQGFNLFTLGDNAVPVELVETPVLDGNGDSDGYVTVARDVSERLRAQEAHERALLEQAARAAAEREHERALLKSEISLILADFEQPEPIRFQAVAERMIPLFGDWCVIDAHDDKGALRRMAVAHIPSSRHALEDGVRRTPPEIYEPATPVTRSNWGKTSFVREVTDGARATMAGDAISKELLDEIGARSLLSVPLVARAQVLGTLTVMYAESGRTYDERDLPFAAQLAERCAIALDNARLHREREKLVEDLTRTVRFSEMFVGILGHDLRNPLSAIATAASLILTRAESERIRNPAARILTSSDRMSRMIDQILDFTHVRLRQGIPLQPKHTDLAEVCRAVLDELKGDADQESQLRLELRGTGVGIWDADRLSQLVSNLAGNAVQHRKQGTPIVLTVDGSRGDRVVLEVYNDGVVSSEVLPVIFEPFRSSEYRKREGSSGLGLGLYISQQIAIAHGGSISVESEPARGTRFIVDLPRTPPAETDQVFSSRGPT